MEAEGRWPRGEDGVVQRGSEHLGTGIGKTSGAPGCQHHLWVAEMMGNAVRGRRVEACTGMHGQKQVPGRRIQSAFSWES